MSIDTANKLEKGLDSKFNRLIVRKPSITSNAVAGEYFSLFRGATGIPVQGAIPTTTPTAANHTTLGGISYRQPVAPEKAYIGEINYYSGATTPQSTIEIHDRLVHSGGLSGNTTTLQTITGFNLDSFVTANNIQARVGEGDYSDIQWWIEWYADTGGTASNTGNIINVTYNDNTTGALSNFVFGRRLGRMIPLNSLVPAADTGKYIKGINSFQLGTATGTVGNFGFVATRYRAATRIVELNVAGYADWTNTGLPVVEEQACLFPILIISPGTNASAGTVDVDGKIIYG